MSESMTATETTDDKKEPALKYSARDRSILLPHYKRFFVNPTLPFIPQKVNPNAITHGGHLLNLAALLMLGWAIQTDKGWPFIVVALLVHLYLWCDNADGGHARRTNQCSAKGEFLDHGLDLLNATYVAAMNCMCLGAPKFWSITAVVIVPAAAAVTYWEQAETGTFELGMLNQIESIFSLTGVLIIRAVFGLNYIESIQVFGFSLPVLILMFVSTVACFGIFHSAYRVMKKRGRVKPFIAPLLFGVAVLFVAQTEALGTLAAIVAGTAVFVFHGVRQLNVRIRKERPFTERGVIYAALILAAIALYRMTGRAFSPFAVDWAAATTVTVLFGGLALLKALEGHRAVERLDRGEA
jgi:phosphatidylglycerophosphate synthase